MADSQQYLFTDRQHLTTSAYNNSANLDARKAIYQYQQKPFELLELAPGDIAWRGDETVLDVGCGTGQYLRHLAQHPGMQLLGFDLSRGMLADLAQQWHSAAPLPVRAVVDAQVLPLPDACCDVVLAMHMLYHVPDIAQAAREFRRVLRPGGVLLVMTNGEAHTRELYAIYNTAVEHITGQPMPYESAFRRFTLENGEQPLRSAFTSIERHDWHGELRVPDGAPVLRYLESSRANREPALPKSIAWDAVRAEVERLVTAEIAAQSVFRVRTASGVFVCR